MLCLFTVVVSVLVNVSAGPATESFKGQYCTDPRTMQKHPAYTEWADAYSCTRHRCQPGGRNLAIYTVGCKRVEAPESAIECEEVVEDTNMQFPYCCTRLRCLVVVRGEVWTRVLGQPWETLPAAPWSHMYKMKKPPPPSGSLINKNSGAGPVYELTTDTESESQKVLRASKKGPTVPDCNDVKPMRGPDIVIALATEPEAKEIKKTDNRHKRRKIITQLSDEVTEKGSRNNEIEFEESPFTITEKAPETSDEKIASVAVTRKSAKAHQAAWTEIPQKEWNEQDPATDNDNTLKENSHTGEPEEEKKPALQALVDAIGTRMRDIETVVQKMSEKVHPGPGEADSNEKKMSEQLEVEVVPPRSYHKTSEYVPHGKPKQPASDNEHYKRFTARTRGSKYLRAADTTSEPPLFVEDARLTGYFSDASNSVHRRASVPKEPAQYLAPVDNHRKAHTQTDSAETNKKHTRRMHKKKGKSHKKHHNKDKKKKQRLASAELEKNVISAEDNSAVFTV